MAKVHIEDFRAIRRAVIYTRVSTDKQEEEGTSLDVQVTNCLAYARENGIEVIEVFREVYTGSLYRERPLLSKLRQMARNREFDVIIINTFDRFSRNQTHQAVLWDEMQHLGISIECVKEKFDETPAGQFMRSALSFVAEVERQKILDRSMAGKRRRVEEGKLNRSWKPKYGYKWKDENKEEYTYKEEEAVVVHGMFITFTTIKASLIHVARMLTEQGIPTPLGKLIWDKATVYRMLSDPIYIGKAYAFRYHSEGERPKEEWIPLPDGLIPPIIDEETFNKVQEILKTNKEESVRNNSNPEEGLLRAGFVRCGYCKRAMTVNRRDYKRKTKETFHEVIYRCRYRYQSNPRCPQAPTIDIKKIDDAVWQYVGEIIQDFSLIEKAVQLVRERGNPTIINLASLNRSIKLAEMNQEQLVGDLSQRDKDGTPKLKGRARQLVLDELQKVEEYLEDLEQEKQNIEVGMIEWERVEEEIDTFLAWCLSARETYPTATYDEKRRALRMLGIVAYVYRGDDSEHDPFEVEVSIPDLRSIVLQKSINSSRMARIPSRA